MPCNLFADALLHCRYYIYQVQSLWHDASVMRMFGAPIVVLACTSIKTQLLEHAALTKIVPGIDSILTSYPNLRVPASNTSGKLAEEQMVELVVHCCMRLVAGSTSALGDVDKARTLLSTVLADEPGLQVSISGWVSLIIGMLR